MQIEFAKYVACGNDFIIMNNLNKNHTEISKFLCQQHLGVDGDGCIFYDKARNRMFIYNRDGTRATMCGNGIRCLIKYLLDNNINREKHGIINTDVGVVKYSILSFAPFVVNVYINNVQFLERYEYHSVEGDGFFDVVFASTLHAVVKTQDFAQEKLESIAKSIQAHKVFKDSCNVDFMRVKDQHVIDVITYERGVGFSNGCGSGACACVFIGVLNHTLKYPCIVNFKVESVIVDFDADNVQLCGSAKHVFSGIVEYEE